jgi:imidazolonepropionase-like amidohydrolase
MHDAGMEPVEILKSGSVNIARYFGQDGQYGLIKSGAAADFVLVSGNPLEDLSRLKNIEGLMLRGQWISKEKIQTELKRIEEKNVRR